MSLPSDVTDAIKYAAFIACGQMGFRPAKVVETAHGRTGHAVLPNGDPGTWCSDVEGLLLNLASTDPGIATKAAAIVNIMNVRYAAHA